MAVCTSIGYSSMAECISASQGEEMVEVRADLCGFPVGETVMLLKEIQCPKMLTARGRFTDEFILKVLGRLGYGDIQYVDLELDAPREYSDRVRQAVHAVGGQFLVSFHDFSDTPCIDELQEIYDICISRGADIVKVVTTASCVEEASGILQLYRQNGLVKPLVAFAMGKAGIFTRRLCLSLGAPFTYCSAAAGSSTAPGQMTSAQMREELSQESYPIDLHDIPLRCEAAFPCSKSFAQRAIISAALASGVSVLRHYAGCDDTEAAVGVARSLGARVSRRDGLLEIVGIAPEGVRVSRLNVGESGLLARLMVPVSSLFVEKSGPVTVEGGGTLLRRDLSDVDDAVAACGGAAVSDGGGVPVTLREAVKGGIIEMDGSRSSQSVSGLLMTLPLLAGDSILTVSNAVSIPYLEMTVRVLEKFGIGMECRRGQGGSMVFRIPGGQKYHPSEFDLEPDWSSAAYLVAAEHLARHLRPDWKLSLPDFERGTGQADERIVELVEKCGSLESFEFDATDCPDLFPIAAVLACFCRGKSELKGVGRLYWKESDRAEAIFSELTQLGAEISITEDRMRITGGHLHGGLVKSHHDHRMVMALTVAALFIDEPIRIDEVDCVSKSFPGFAGSLSELMTAARFWNISKKNTNGI